MSWKSEWMVNNLNNIHKTVHLHLEDGFPHSVEVQLSEVFLNTDLN